MGGFPNDRVARDECRHDLGEGDGGREVERRNDRGNPARLQATFHHQAVNILLVGLALERQTLRRDTLQDTNGFIEVQLAVKESFPHLPGHGLLKIFEPGRDNLGQLQEYLCFDVPTDAAPEGKRRFGGEYRRIDFRIRRLRDISQNLRFMSGNEVRQKLCGRRVAPLPGDINLIVPRGI